MGWAGHMQGVHFLTVCSVLSRTPWFGEQEYKIRLQYFEITFLGKTVFVGLFQGGPGSIKVTHLSG